MFFSFILVPELSKQVQGTPGMNFHQVSSKSEDLGTSYDQKPTKTNETNEKRHLARTIVKIDNLGKTKENPRGTLGVP